MLDGTHRTEQISLNITAQTVIVVLTYNNILYQYLVVMTGKKTFCGTLHFSVLHRKVEHSSNNSEFNIFEMVYPIEPVRTMDLS